MFKFLRSLNLGTVCTKWAISYKVFDKGCFLMKRNTLIVYCIFVF